MRPFVWTSMRVEYVFSRTWSSQRGEQRDLPKTTTLRTGLQLKLCLEARFDSGVHRVLDSSLCWTSIRERIRWGASLRTALHCALQHQEIVEAGRDLRNTSDEMELRAKSLRSRSSTNTQVFDARVSAFPAAAVAASAGISLRRRRAFVGDRIPAGAPIHAEPANTVNLQWQRPVPGRQMHRRLPVRQHQWRVRVLPRRPIRSGPEGAVRAVRRGAILRLLRRSGLLQLHRGLLRRRRWQLRVQGLQRGAILRRRWQRRVQGLQRGKHVARGGAELHQLPPRARGAARRRAQLHGLPRRPIRRRRRGHGVCQLHCRHPQRKQCPQLHSLRGGAIHAA